MWEEPVLVRAYSGGTEKKQYDLSGQPFSNRDPLLGTCITVVPKASAGKPLWNAPDAHVTYPTSTGDILLWSKNMSY
jgi:hypothetical protein